MNLTENPETVSFPETHYVFVEKIGPFMENAGAAWQNIALQAWIKGYATHGMQGFDYDKARTELRVPPEFAVECMIAIGKPGPKEKLPSELQEREFPNARRPIRETIAEGKFSAHLVHLQKK